MRYEISADPSIFGSAFPVRRYPFQDIDKNGREIIIAPGRTIPDYIRAVYGIDKIEGIKENFPFLDRDNKERDYQPDQADPFTMKNTASVAIFGREARQLLRDINQLWKSLGLSVKFDSDRGCDVPNATLDSIPLTSLQDAKVRADISLLASNADIVKKAAVQRTILPGWWAVSYAGQHAKNFAYFKRSLGLIEKLFKHLETGEQFKKELAETIRTQGDPLDTTVGFPSYSAEMTKDGLPAAKLLMLDQYKGIATGAVQSWETVTAALRARGRTKFERDYLFGIAPIRRLQPGRKRSHVWTYGPAGLRTDYDIRGLNTVRVAWMAPYLLNLFLSPMQSRWKSLRKVIPGLYHDGSFKRTTLHSIKQRKLIVMESDFSNYDRSIPVDLTANWMQSYAQRTARPRYWGPLLLNTQQDLPLIWPDYVSGERGRGWAFTPTSVALMSGLKITAEVGTFTNLIINVAGWLEEGVMTEAEIMAYLSQYRDSKPDSIDLKVLIQSDDTAFLSDSIANIEKLTKSFSTAAKAAGIGSSVEIGDKFLMRHMSNGKDTPVLMRIWQNTLSNEEPETDSLIFLVGLLLRSDGVLGQKTFDPFNTGRLNSISAVDRTLTTLVMQSIERLLRAAARPQREAIDYVHLLVEAASSMDESNGQFTMRPEYVAKLNELRLNALKVLAHRELTMMAKKDAAQQSYLQQLLSNSQSPTAAAQLALILQAQPQLQTSLDNIAQKEHQFYSFAMRKLGITQEVDMN